MVPSERLRVFWTKVESSRRAVALVSKGKNVDSKFSVNFSKVFSEAARAELFSLSYHISEKETPRPLLILLRAVMIFSVSRV